ncbi:MAG: hypothetical protein DRR19_21195 [Candidatus Parabeggiatoa sp. nov. 1]|nr:MAG: hypothetical protein DRR19_21195 [Gammaproteobacteria bacterium]
MDKRIRHQILDYLLDVESSVIATKDKFAFIYQSMRNTSGKLGLNSFRNKIRCTRAHLHQTTNDTLPVAVAVLELSTTN